MTDGTMGDRKEPVQRRMERRSSGNDLVSALCQPSRQYPSSAPSTPVAKAVRFDDSQLEEVRHFFQLDQPLAISTPEEETFDHPLALTHADGIFWMPHAEENLVIDLTNFPVDTPARRTRVVRLEHLTLSDERGFLQGTVSVANLSYHKHVACRFTFDDWQTIHEVKGHYTTPGRTKHPPEGYDSFFFSIDLRDLIGLSAKTLRCCVRCNTGGCEYWDNNDGANFDVRFASATKAADFTTASDTFRTLPIRSDIAQGPDEVARTRAARFEKSPSPLNRKPDHSARRSPNRLEGLTIDIGRQPLSRSYDLERSLLEAKKAGEGARKKGTS